MGHGDDKMALENSVQPILIKTEHPPDPQPFVVLDPAMAITSPTLPAGNKDPEDLLKRCSGHNKKTKLRCSVTIGKKTQQITHPTFLPTCSAHRDQQTHAGWCQYEYENGAKCATLFKWKPPHFELCPSHRRHHSLPCHFLKLPLELRHEIFRYLLPTKHINSSTAALHDYHNREYHGRGNGNTPLASITSLDPRFTSRPTCEVTFTSESIFPTPLLNLFLVNRQIYYEAKDLFFSIAMFTIDIRKDGTFMCGRRLLEPRRADGSSHFLADEADGAKEKFLKAFNWSAVKNYSVDILLENWSSPHPHMASNSSWDEEVEIYDIRDYVSVVVSGILAKSSNLCKLQVRLCLADFQWSIDQILANTKLIVSPFERLRNVRQPQIGGVFVGRPYHNAMLSVQRAPARRIIGANMSPAICSVPSLPNQTPVLSPGLPDFDAYASEWSQLISSTSSAPVTKKAPIRTMFTEFKDFYCKLANIVPQISYQNGRHAFLHRARVAREQEDVQSFRQLRNEIIQHWNTYLDQEEQKKNDMNSRLSRMLDTDVYPCHEWDNPDVNDRRNSAASQGSSRSPVMLNVDTMAKEGIPMTGNPRRTQLTMPNGRLVTAEDLNLKGLSPQEICALRRQIIQLQQQKQMEQQTLASLRNHAMPGLPSGNSMVPSMPIGHVLSSKVSSPPSLGLQEQSKPVQQTPADLLVQQQQMVQMNSQSFAQLQQRRQMQQQFTLQQRQYMAQLMARHQQLQQNRSTPTSANPWASAPVPSGIDVDDSTTSDPIPADDSKTLMKRMQSEIDNAPGPSNKRIKLEKEQDNDDSYSCAAMCTTVDQPLVDSYVGKGKEKMVSREVICID